MNKEQATIREAFRSQSKFCQELGSPFAALVCQLFAERLRVEDGAVAAYLLDSARAKTAVSSALALRILGSLHSLVLSQQSAELVAAFPPHYTNRTSEEIWEAIRLAMMEEEAFLLARLESPPQTNEVRRSCILLPGFLTIASLTELPLTLTEIGASAGLNLWWDRYSYRLGQDDWGDPASTVRLEIEWQGETPPSPEIEIRTRAGCDQAPPDLSNEDDRIRLLSYIWPDQFDRFERARAAIDFVRDSGQTVASSDVLDWLPSRIAEPAAGTVHVVYHTIMWQYLSPHGQEATSAMIRNAGAMASETAPLAWLRFEPDGAGPGGALTLTMWPSADQRCIARADFHGRWVEWLGWST